MDVNDYLRRFIDIEFILPEVKLGTFISHLLNQFGLQECFEKRKQATKGHINDKIAFDSAFSKLCTCFRLSMRDTEHCCRLFSIAHLNTADINFICPDLLMILVIMKLVDSKLYHKYVTGKCTGEEVIKLILMQPGGQDFLLQHNGMIIDAYLLAASSHMRKNNAIFSRIKLLIENKQLTEPDSIPERIKKMSNNSLYDFFKIYLSFLEHKVSKRTLGSLSQKIELASLMLDYRE